MKSVFATPGSTAMTRGAPASEYAICRLFAWQKTTETWQQCPLHSYTEVHVLSYNPFTHLDDSVRTERQQYEYTAQGGNNL